MTRLEMPNVRGRLLFDEPLSRYNTWGVGGNAQCLFQPADLDDLRHFFANSDPALAATWLGLGSNVLVRDAGIKGVVIITQGGLDKVQFINQQIYAQAGVACAKLARAAVRKNLTGIEFMAGIPGTVGGALVMNAGAFGSQTWDQVDSVEVINRQGKIFQRNASDFTYGYRQVQTHQNEWFVSACLRLKKPEQTDNVVSIKALLAKRAATQPVGKKNCGCVFKNPANAYAASLIENCGLKGFSIGGACVSTKHANFILNQQQATAADIEALIEHIQASVREKYNLELIPEVRFLGDKKNFGDRKSFADKKSE